MLIQEITAGDRVLGIASVAGRLDNRPFTRPDLAGARGFDRTGGAGSRAEAIRAQAEMFARAAAIDLGERL